MYKRLRVYGSAKIALLPENVRHERQKKDRPRKRTLRQALRNRQPTAKGMQNRTGFSELMDYEGRAKSDRNYGWFCTHLANVGVNVCAEGNYRFAPKNERQIPF